MSFFRHFLREHRRGLWLWGVTYAMFFLCFALYRLPFAAVAYPAILGLLMGTVYLAADYRRERERHCRMEELTGMPNAVLAALPEARTAKERDSYQIIRVLRNALAEQDDRNTAALEDMTAYYTTWAHEIKTPIASMRLALQGEDTALSRRLGSDLFRIEQYVEMVMAFLRLKPGTSDYVFRKHELDSILRRCIRRFAPEFIGRKLCLDYTPVELRLVTDEKWLAFVIEQVLSNALKYTPAGGTVTIRMEGDSVLTVADTGIGIAPEDLPRIFERGYTGANGRTDMRASGLGLYLCARICKNLGIGISARSQVGEGTVICLDLAQRDIRPE